MKTINRLARLLCLGSVLSLALSVTAFADSDYKGVAASQRQYQLVPKSKKVLYYVKTSASAIPQPLERLGGIPTTTIPLVVIGDPRNSN
jgi:hypothetical protein